MRIDRTRQWITSKYNASAWYRLAFIGAVSGSTVGLAWIQVRAGFGNAWFVGLLMTLWITAIVLAGTWLVTWHPPDVHEPIANTDMNEVLKHMTPFGAREEVKDAADEIIRQWRFHFVPVARREVPKSAREAGDFAIYSRGFQVQLRVSGECWLGNRRSGKWFVSTAAVAVKEEPVKGN